MEQKKGAEMAESDAYRFSEPIANRPNATLGLVPEVSAAFGKEVDQQMHWPWRRHDSSRVFLDVFKLLPGVLHGV